MYAASLFISFVHNTSSLGPFCIVWSILMVLFYVFFFKKKTNYRDFEGNTLIGQILGEIGNWASLYHL
jgi:hypothetical protein